MPTWSVNEYILGAEVSTGIFIPGAVPCNSYAGFDVIGGSPETSGTAEATGAGVSGADVTLGRGCTLLKLPRNEVAGLGSETGMYSGVGATEATGVGVTSTTGAGVSPYRRRQTTIVRGEAGKSR